MTTQQTSGTRKRVLLLVLLGTVAVAGAIALPGRTADEDESAQPLAAPGAESTLEVQPVLMRGKIRAASWRGASASRAPVAEDETPRDDVDPFDRDPRRERYERSLEETVEPISGLGVYVAPADEPKGAR